MHGNELRLFLEPRPYSYYKCRRAFDIAAVGTTFNVFSYDAVLGRVFEAKLWLSHIATVPRPRLEPITFPCRANALHVMPRMRVFQRDYYWPSRGGHTDHSMTSDNQLLLSPHETSRDSFVLFFKVTCRISKTDKL